MVWSKIVRNLVFEKRSIRHISIAIHLMWRLANGLDNAVLNNGLPTFQSLSDGTKIGIGLFKSKNNGGWRG